MVTTELNEKKRRRSWIFTFDRYWWINEYRSDSCRIDKKTKLINRKRFTSKQMMAWRRQRTSKISSVSLFVRCLSTHISSFSFCVSTREKISSISCWQQIHYGVSSSSIDLCVSTVFFLFENQRKKKKIFCLSIDNYLVNVNECKMKKNCRRFISMKMKKKKNNCKTKRIAEIFFTNIKKWTEQIVREWKFDKTTNDESWKWSILPDKNNELT